VAGRADASGLCLHVDIDPAVIAMPLHADSRALTQILLNLLSNAVKFTPTGGRVTVSAQAIPDGVRFAVKDTGRGIAKEDIPRLANAFEQVSTDADLSKQGTGLGLALVRSLAELHGGQILIESEIDVGTVVTVDIPVEGRATQAAQ
jgi:signal transduction histidine kinase